MTRVSRLALATAVIVGLLAPWSGSASATTSRTVVLDTGVPLAAGSATAAASRVVVSRQGVPAAFSINTFGCNGAAFDVEFIHVAGPAKPPLGTGSLDVSGPGITDISLSGSRPASQLTALSLYADSIHGTDPSFLVRLTLNSNGSTADVLDLAAGPSGTWSKLSPLTATVELGHENLSTHALTDAGTTTFAAYQTDNPGATLDNVELLNTNCSPSGVSSVALDDVTLGFSGATPTTYDFEPDSHLSISIAAPAKIVKGGEATIHGFIIRGNEDFQGVPIELQASAKGTHGWVDADSLVSTWNAALHSEQFLNTTTKFRFVCAGSTAIGPVTSKVVTVRVVPPPKKKHHKKHG